MTGFMCTAKDPCSSLEGHIIVWNRWTRFKSGGVRWWKREKHGHLSSEKAEQRGKKKSGWPEVNFVNTQGQKALLFHALAE
jgi:hypothetical protein